MTPLQRILFTRVERLIEWRKGQLIAGSFEQKADYTLGGPHVGFDTSGLRQFVDIDMNQPQHGFTELLKSGQEFSFVDDGISTSTNLRQLGAIVHRKRKNSLRTSIAYKNLLQPIIRRDLKVLIDEIASSSAESKVVDLRADIGEYLPLTAQRDQLHRGINLNFYKFLLSPYQKQDIEGTGSTIVRRILINAIAV